MSRYVAIMAGGVGSRFWPASRERRPKQFLDILGTGKSLLRLTFERFLGMVPADRILVVTNEQYRELVQQELPELSDHQILGEPSRNNTAPCVAWTAFHLHQLDPDANFVVAPSDHLILKEQAFLEALQRALDFTERHDALLTLGIRPVRPDTGYGYIQYVPEAQHGVHKVVRFTEKPPLEQAKAYLASGDYLWNAGIFVWRAATVLDAFATHAPDIYRILEAGRQVYGTPQETDFIRQAYPTTPDISVDYAIMEKADNIYTIPADIGWSDLGTWASLHAHLDKDEAGNVLQGDRLLVQDVHDAFVRVPRGKVAVLRGLDDFIVVDEGDVLLIWPKSEEQAIKAVRKEVGARFGKDLI